MLLFEATRSLLNIVFVYLRQSLSYFKMYLAHNTVQAGLGLKWHKTETNDLVMQLFRPTHETIMTSESDDSYTH